MHIDLVEQFSIPIVVRINNSKYTLQNSSIWKQFFRHAGKIKHQSGITDAVGLHFMMYQLHAVHFHLFVVNRSNLFCDIGSVEHRNLLHILRRIF